MSGEEIVEWAVRHSQGIYQGQFGRALTEEQARRWMAESVKRDAARRLDARGKQRLLRRTVTAWVEVEADQ